jgi:hypothetical protein
MGKNTPNQIRFGFRFIQSYEFRQRVEILQSWFGSNHFSHRDMRLFAFLFETNRPSSVARSPRPIFSRTASFSFSPSKVSTSTTYAAGRPCWVIRIGSLSLATAAIISVALRFNVVTNSVLISDTLVVLCDSGEQFHGTQ